ncbi:MAG: RND transporter [Pirellulales bacterium]|nr:RND transporter [Pirellulales bacterium]
MEVISKMKRSLFLLLTIGVLTLIGCGKTGTPGTQSGKQTAEPVSEVAVNWCVEHGVPEDICAQCNPKVAADFKQKGDWCKEHNRPESQCFQCNPKLVEKFAADYEAKYGKKPPKPEGM